MALGLSIALRHALTGGHLRGTSISGHLTRAYLIVVITAVFTRNLRKVVVVVEGDTSVITFVITIDEPGYTSAKQILQLQQPEYDKRIAEYSRGDIGLTCKTGNFPQCLCSEKKSCSHTCQGMLDYC